jgi:four helix bundle protein
MKQKTEERLIKFSVQILDLADNIKTNDYGRNLINQMARAGTSSALNYGEAQSAESRRDFIHKISLVLKELRETYNCLKIIEGSNLFKNKPGIVEVINENKELTAIFQASVFTAKKKISD